MSIYEAIGRRVAELRRAAGLSGERLGERAGISAAYVSRIERGRRGVTLDVLARVAEALGVPLSQLVTDPKAAPRAEITHLLEAASALPDEDVRLLSAIALRLRR